MINKLKLIDNILDEHFYEDVKNIILKYLTCNCKWCDKEILEDDAFESYNGKFYCLKCRTENLQFIHKCENCHLAYDIRETHGNCVLCFTSCWLYCPKCCLELYGIDCENNTTENVGNHIKYFWISEEYRDNLFYDLINAVDGIELSENEI